MDGITQMMRKLRTGGVAATMTAIALFAAACGNNANVAEETVTDVVTDVETEVVHEATETATDVVTEDVTETAVASGDPVTCTWWHNGTGEPLLSFWDTIGQEFHEQHPNVTVNVQAFQNEELRDTILPNAFASNTAPDVFQSWGGGELASYVEHNQVMDVSEFIPAPIHDAAVVGFQPPGSTGIYGMPYTFLPSGFWVNMNLWHEAGLTDFPTTLEELYADWDTLREHGITPVAVGGVDGWPAAHWWYWAALREVPPAAMQAAIEHGDFSDPGWERASELVTQIVDRNAFNQGWQATSAQQGAASASGMVVLGQAAMQLMGTWDYGVMGGLYNEAQGLAEDAQDHANFLGWFPFPAVAGAAGDEHAIMGGVDGFSVREGAPRECAELLAYIVSTPVQERYAAMGNIPVDSGATHSMPAGPLQPAAEAVANASSVQLWLDTALGPVVGGGMNQAIIAYMSGQGTPQDVVTALTDLAAQR